MTVDEIVQGYLDSVGVKAAQHSLDFLKKLHRAHIALFSFNNIDVLLGKPISLELTHIFEKVVLHRRGGYCFEHNKLFYEILQALGFDVRMVLARVLNNRSIDAPRTHRVTILNWNGDRYLLDVGFGPLSPRGPILLREYHTESYDEIIYKITKNEHGEYVLSTKMGDEFYTMYSFDMGRYSESDCAVGNYYSYSHPTAVFVNNLVVSLITSKRTLSLRNNSYFRIENEVTDKIEIVNSMQLEAFLKEDFGIELTAEECAHLFDCIERIQTNS